MLAERYRLDSRIAFGGVGEVWRGTDLVLGREVAVKLLRSGYAEHPETLTRFRDEARHAGSLMHPAVAQVYDYGEGDPPYLVMELVDGPSLAELLRGQPRLSPVRTLDVVAQAAAGLAAAHATGLVHRDIKPANLLIGPGGIVKITDFGIAHAAGSAPLTVTGALVGTPAYLAPERAEGAPATPASDLYSLGVVAYECLSGRQPFHGTPLEMAVAHRLRPLPPLPAGLPAGVAALVADLTAKDAAARPASAEAVAERARHLRDAIEAGAVAPGIAAHGPAAPRAITEAAGPNGTVAGGVVAGGAGAAVAGAAAARVAGPAAAGAGPPPAGEPAADAATLAGVPLPPPPRAHGWRGRSWHAHGWRDRVPIGRGVLLALALFAVAAGITGWLIAAAVGQPAARGRAGPQPTQSAPAPHRPAPARHTTGDEHGGDHRGPGGGQGDGPGPGGGDGHGHGGDGQGNGNGGRGQDGDGG
jgi:serine/threonine-protein kinase